MYRIELRPGEEALFKSFDEFAKAVHTGIVSSHARIWHNASNKWLPIDFHPHFKRAVATPPAAAAPVPVRAARVQKTRELTFLEVEPKVAVPARKPEPARAAAPIAAPAAAPVAPPAPTPAPSAPVVAEAAPASPFARPPRQVEAAHLFPAPEPVTPRHIEALVAAVDRSEPAPAEPAGQDEHEILIDIGRRRRLPTISRRQVTIAAGVTFLLLAGWAIATRAPAAADDDTDAAVASTTLGASPRTSFEIRESTPSGPVMPASYMRMEANPDAPALLGDTLPAPDSTPRVIPRAPRVAGMDAMTDVTGGSTSTSPSALAHRYRTAYAEVAAGFERQLRTSGLANLFAASRLTSDRVGDLRVAVAGASNFVRTHRRRDEALDAAYRDTAMQFAAEWNAAEKAAWARSVTQGETAAEARATDALLADMSALLGVLEAEAGMYEIVNGAFRFSDSTAAVQYDALRQRVAAALDQPASGQLGQSLRRVLGSARPPAAGS